jgi:hypothetical protein
LKTTLPIKVTIDTNTRWEEGIAHDPRSEEIFDWISEYDFKFNNDYFCWKSGGDGDNGEELLYELDEYFAAKDKEKQNKIEAKKLLSLKHGLDIESIQGT